MEVVRAWRKCVDSFQHGSVVRTCGLFVHLLLPIAALLAAGLAFASGRDANDLNVGRRHWTSAQGLPQDAVLAMAQTHDGYLWLATEGGLARFDGVRFLTFDRRSAPGLASDYVQALSEDTSGVLWIGTAGGGVCRYRNGAMQRLDSWPVMAGETVYALLALSDGSVWAGTEKGISVIRGDRVHHFSKDEGFPQVATYSLTQTKDGSIWFGTYGSGLGRYRETHVTNWTKKQGLSDNRVILVQAQDSGAVWVSSYGGSLQSFAAETFKTVVAARTRSANQGIWAIRTDGKGRSWLGSFGAGLGALKDGKARFLDGLEGVPAETVWSLLEDREGNLWVGSSDGLYQFRNLPFTTFTRTDGLPGNVVSSICQRRDHSVWVGTNAGLVKWARQGVGMSKQLLPFTRHEVLSAVEDDEGVMWLGTAGHGLLSLRPESSRATLAVGPWGNNPIHAVAFDRSGHLLVGTFGAGLFTCQRLQGHLSCVPLTGARSDRVMTMLVSRTGDLWVGTRDGLARFHRQHWSKLTTANGLGSNQITSLYEDRAGDLWIGSEGGGLARYASEHLTRVGREQGLFDDSVYSIQEDSFGRLWMGSPRGVFRIEKSHFLDGRFPLTSVSYGLLDGMVATQCFADTPNASAQTADGALWFGTIKGLAQIYPRQLKTNSLPPPVLLEEARLDGIAVPIGTSLEIPTHSRRLEIDYTALSLTVPEKQRFRYRMEGYDERWIEAGTNRTLSYTNLPPGSYKLVIRANNDDGVWNQRGTQLQIEWRPQFYRTSWFLSLIALSLAVLVFAVHRYRVWQVEERHGLILAERTRIAREIHDTLAHCFTGILMQLQAATEYFDLNRQITEACIDRAESLGREGLKQARDSVMVLSPAEPQTDLVERIRLCVERAFTNTGRHPEIHVTGSIKPLNAVVSANALQICNEALNNAQRYAKANQIDIALVFHNDALSVQIRDDGIGFDPETVAGSGFGLTGMKARAERIGGTLSIDSAFGCGTVVTLNVPFRLTAHS